MRLMNYNAAALLSVIIASASISQHVIAQTSSFEQPDNYQWLEDVSSPRALAWVKTENERTAKLLEGDHRYTVLALKALQVFGSPDRLPSPEFHGDQIYNLWQDPGHAHGVLRHATLSSYFRTKPNWHTVIDY